MDTERDETETLTPSAAEAQVPAVEGQALAHRQDPGGKPWSNNHAVNLRLSVPFFGGRYYLTVVGGRERRSRQRLAFERKKHPLRTTGNILFLLAFGTLLGLGAMAMILLTALAILERNGALAAW